MTELVIAPRRTVAAGTVGAEGEFMAIDHRAVRNGPRGVDSVESEPDQGFFSNSVISSRMLSGGLVTILAVLIGVIWWARNRGLDLTDEGYYLQLFAHPDSAPASVVPSQFYLLVDLVTGPMDLAITGYRVVALVLLVASAGFLGFSLHRFAREWIPEVAIPPVLATVSFVAVCGLLGYSWAPLAVSYNTLSAAIIQVVAGLVLLALAGSRGSQPVLSWAPYVALAGALLPLLFYIKWPAAVLLAGILAVVVSLVLRWAGRKFLVVAAAGSVASFAFFTEELLVGPFSFQSLVTSAGRASFSGYGPADLAADYLLMGIADTFRVLWDDPLRVLALILLLAGGPLTVLGRSKASWLRPWMLSLVGAGYLLAEIPGASYLDRMTNFKLVAALAVATIISIVLAQAVKTGRPPDISVRELSRAGQMMWLLALLGVGLALISGAGSSSHILTNSLHGGAGFGVALVIAVSSLRTMAGRERHFSFSIAMPVLAVLVAAQIVNGVAVDPYRLTSARVHHQVSIPEIPRFEGISFDPRSAEFLRSVNNLIQEETSFAPGDTVLTYASVYGLVYMIDGVSPGVPWIYQPESGWQDQACPTLRAVGDEVAETTLILENSAPSEELAACLREVLPGYPERFVEVGRVGITRGYGAGMSTGQFLRVLELRG